MVDLGFPIRETPDRRPISGTCPNFIKFSDPENICPRGDECEGRQGCECCLKAGDIGFVTRVCVRVPKAR